MAIARRIAMAAAIKVLGYGSLLIEEAPSNEDVEQLRLYVVELLTEIYRASSRVVEI